MDVKFAKIHPDAIIPKFQTSGAAAADLYSCTEYVVIYPGETAAIKIGIKSEFPSDYVALIYARSGLATRQGLAPANKVGVIDSDYRGEWIVALHNHSNEPREVHKGDRVAQVIFQEVVHPNVIETNEDELSNTDRGTGGFGSTGK